MSDTLSLLQAKEYYFEAKTLRRTDKKNNLIGIVTDKKLASSFRTISETGMDVTSEANLSNGKSINGGFIVNRDILNQTNEIYKLSLTEKGKVGEYNSAMTSNGDSYTATEIKYVNDKAKDASGNNYTGGKIASGEVSIHSHPTGSSWDGDLVLSSDATPSPAFINPATNKVDGDGEAFKSYDMNIIVGRRKPAEGLTQEREGRPTQKTITDYPMIINFYGKGANEKSKPIHQLEPDENNKILESPKGKAYEKYQQNKK